MKFQKEKLIKFTHTVFVGDESGFQHEASIEDIIELLKQQPSDVKGRIKEEVYAQHHQDINEVYNQLVKAVHVIIKKYTEDEDKRYRRLRKIIDDATLGGHNDASKGTSIGVGFERLYEGMDKELSNTDVVRELEDLFKGQWVT